MFAVNDSWASHLLELSSYKIVVFDRHSDRHLLSFGYFQSWKKFCFIKVLVVTGGNSGIISTEVLYYEATEWVYGTDYPTGYLYWPAPASIDNNIFVIGTIFNLLNPIAFEILSI